MATKGSRNGSMLKRHSQIRRKTTKKQEKPTDCDKTGEQSVAFNFTVNLKNTELEFKTDTEKSKTEDDKSTTDGDVVSKDVEDTKPVDKIFSPSRTIVSAVARNDLELLEELLSRPNDENDTIKGLSREAELQHALMLAISNKQCALVQKLLEAGADLHLSDHAYPILMMALDVRAKDVFHLLVEHAKTLKVYSSYGNLIHAAARTGDVELLKLVTEKLEGEGLNDKTKGMGVTPLHEAVKSVRFIPKEKPKSLFEFSQKMEWNTSLPKARGKYAKKRGVKNKLTSKIDTSTCSTSTTIDTVNKYGGYDMACIDYLIGKGCDINAQDISGKTALHECAILGNLAVAKRLIEANADVTIADNKHHTAVMYAIKQNYNVALTELFSDEKTLHLPITSDGQCHVHLACSAGHLSALEYFVSAGCDINQQWEGKTPLMIAIAKENYSCAQYLLTRPDCNIALIPTEGNSALELLLESETRLAKKKPLLDSMIKRGVDISKILINNEPTTPLIYTLKNTNYEWSQQLIECGADVNVIGVHGEYALLQACHADSTETVQMLLRHHADMTLSSRTSKEYERLTPLQLALRNENVELVKLLLGAGCSIKGIAAWFKTDAGETVKQSFLPDNKHIITYIEELEPAPPTLQDLARVSIRKSTGVPSRCERYEQLPLPSQMKKYLDVDTCLDEFNEFLDSQRDV